MRGPTSVGNAGMRVEDLCQVHSRLGDELLELCNFSDLLEGVDLVLLVAIDRQAGLQRAVGQLRLDLVDVDVAAFFAG